MTQVFHYLRSGSVVADTLPRADAELLAGASWGSVHELFTQSYWVALDRKCEGGRPVVPAHRLGKTLREETAACLLGGYGIPAEVGLEAFRRVRERGHLEGVNPGVGAFLDALAKPLPVEGRRVQYRFTNTKARYLVAACAACHEHPPPLGGARPLRSNLLELPGIGPKTSAWIIRNWLGSSEVANLDIHVVRAGLLRGLYAFSDRVDPVPLSCIASRPRNRGLAKTPDVSDHAEDGLYRRRALAWPRRHRDRSALSGHRQHLGRTT